MWGEGEIQYPEYKTKNEEILEEIVVFTECNSCQAAGVTSSALVTSHILPVTGSFLPFF
jgi:hypothetical protein